MKENFISTLKTDKYMIGDYVPYYDEIIAMVQHSRIVSEENAKRYIEQFKNEYFAAIVDYNLNFAGFIGIKDINYVDMSCNLVFGTILDMSAEDKADIRSTYESWIGHTLKIWNFDGFNLPLYEFESEKIKALDGFNFNKREIVEKIAIYDDDYRKRKSRLCAYVYIQTLCRKDKRCVLKVQVVNSKKRTEILDGINEYIEYLKRFRILYVFVRCSSLDEEVIEVLSSSYSKFVLRAAIPCSELRKGTLCDRLIYENTYSLEKDAYSIDYEPLLRDESILKQKDISDSMIIKLDENYRLISPYSSEFDDEKVLKGYIEAMRDRFYFAEPAGECGYILQKGDNSYGLTKALNDFDYVIVGKENNFVGYIDVKKRDIYGRAIYTSIAIAPKYQNKGIGTVAYSAFLEELFKRGVASVTSFVPANNIPAIKLYEKCAKPVGKVKNNYEELIVYSSVNTALLA